MATPPTNAMRKKLFYVVFLAILVLTGYVCYNLVETSIVKAEYYRGKANSQQLDGFTINANRGTIYDKNEKILARSSTVWTVILAPHDIENNKSNYQTRREKMATAAYNKAVNEGIPATAPTGNEQYSEAEEICKALNEILGVDYDKLIKICDAPDKRYEIVKKKVEKPEADKINAFKAEYGIGENSVYLVEDSKRFYPNDTLASNIIGFTNYDNEGVYGIEAYYNDYLEGTNGRMVMAMDASGNAMPYDYKMNYPAKDGNSIYLTIDEVVQHYLEKNLETTVSQHKVENRATGIIMNAKTGAILAMATSPSYDLNNPSTLSDVDKAKLQRVREDKISNALVIKGYEFGTENDLTESELAIINEEMDALESIYRETSWKNKAVSELYYPGSVFKVITAASALEEQTISTGSTFYCSGELTVVEGTEPIGCWITTGGHGQLSLNEALTKSCNPAFMAIGASLGSNKFSDYFEAFGFTERTGIDLPGESNSIYMPRERMHQIELATSAFGQTNKVTPIQMICAFAAAINGGNLVTPYVVDKIVDSDGNVVKTTEKTVKRQVISEETSAIMCDMLEKVVESNGGANAYISGYRIGGKSGTSEKLDEYPSHSMRYVSTFCAFTPANDPEIVMLVCVDESMSGTYYGSAVAAPVVSEVFKETLEYLEIYPQYTAEEQLMQEIVVPNLKNKSLDAAIAALNAAGLEAEIVGEEVGSTVMKTVPLSGQKISLGGTVVVYLSDEDYRLGTVPDVYGMSIAEAEKAITNAGLNISLSGGAVSNPESRATAKASLQSIAAGTQVAEGTVVEVMFIVSDGQAG